MEIAKSLLVSEEGSLEGFQQRTIYTKGKVFLEELTESCNTTMMMMMMMMMIVLLSTIWQSREKVLLNGGKNSNKTQLKFQVEQSVSAYLISSFTFLSLPLLIIIFVILFKIIQ
jgi:hypothetical protein